MQAFDRFDVRKEGSISLLAFRDIMESIRPHLLTDFVKENLIGVRTPIFMRMWLSRGSLVVCYV